jgi:hypothetical protein
VRADPVSALAGWDAADFTLLSEEARAFQRVGPRALRDPEGFLHEVVAGLFGIRADAEGGRFAVSPWMPDGWRSMAIRRVRFHRTLLDLEVRPRAEWATVRLNLTFGPSIALALSVRNAGPVGRITVDEHPLEGDRAIFTVTGEHEAMFFFEGRSL